MKKSIVFTLLGLVVGGALTLGITVFAAQISVPSPATKGYGLTSTASGTYVATTTSPWTVGWLVATTTTATSTINNSLVVGGLNSYLLVSSTTPNYGYLALDNIDAGGSANAPETITAFNNSAGNCAGAGYVAAGVSAGPFLGNFSLFFHSSTGYTGIGCPNQGPQPGVDSTLIFDPTGNIVSQVNGANKNFQWYTASDVGAASTSAKFIFTAPGSLGISSSSPWAKLSVHAWNGDTNRTLFAIGSSTQTATTTLFSIDNTGTITTAMTGTQCVHEISGVLSGTGSDCGSGGGSFSYPFPLLGLATTSPIMLLASTTIGNGNQNGGLTISGSATTTGKLIVGTVSFTGSVAGDALTVNANGSNNAIAIQNNSASPKAWQIDFSNTNDLDFTEAGVANNRLTLKAGGNLGVNVASPTSMLDVSGNASFGSAYTAIAAPTNGALIQGTTGIGSSSPFANLSVHANNNDTNLTLFAIGSSTQTATTTLFSVSNVGNVGIKTSSALASLDVNGSALIRGTNTNTASSPLAAFELFTGRDSAGSKLGGQTLSDVAFDYGGSGGGFRHWILTKHDTNPDQRNGIEFFVNTSASAGGSSAPGTGNIRVMGLYGNGYVGISSTTPFAKLSTHANAGDTNLVLFAIGSSTQTSTSTLFSVANTGATKIFTPVNNTAAFNVSNSASATAFNVDTTNTTVALVGIGSSSPFANLSVHANNGDTQSVLFAIGSSTQTATTTHFYVTNAGGVFAPDTTSSGASQTGYWCYDASGQLIRDTAVCLVSARRYKQDINSLSPDGALAEVLKLNPVSFYYKPDFNGTLQSNPNFSGEQIGFIADEVQQIDRRATEVTGATTTFEGKDYPAGTVQTVRYQNITALLAGAIQQIEKQISTTGENGRLTDIERKVQTQQYEIYALMLVVGVLIVLQIKRK